MRYFRKSALALGATAAQEQAEENAGADGGKGEGDGPFLDFPSEDTIASADNPGEVGPELVDLGLQCGDIAIRMVSDNGPQCCIFH